MKRTTSSPGPSARNGYFSQRFHFNKYLFMFLTQNFKSRAKTGTRKIENKTSKKMAT